MPVITVVTTGLRVLKRAAQLGQKYKYLDLNQKFIRKYVPPGYRKHAEFALETFIGGGLLYQIVDYAYYAFQTEKGSTPGQPGKTRDNMVKTRGRFGYSRYSNRYRRKRCYSRRRSPYR